MAYQITPVDVWVGQIEDRPGGLADKLEAIAEAGDNLEFMVALRNMNMPETGVLLLSPLHGESEERAAQRGGLTKWTTAHSLKIEGPDRPGLGATITRAVADAGISMRGAAAARNGNHVIFHLAFDGESDADRAAEALAVALAD